MIELNKIYLINTNDLRCGTKGFRINGTISTAIAVANYLLGKKVNLFLICRPGYSSIFLESHTHTEMIQEIVTWMEGSHE